MQRLKVNDRTKDTRTLEQLALNTPKGPPVVDVDVPGLRVVVTLHNDGGIGTEFVSARDGRHLSDKEATDMIRAASLEA